MSDIKVGDRVHVEFDGRVQSIIERGSEYEQVNVNDGRIGGWVQKVHSSHCTVIAPPVKVGDFLTAANAAQMSDLSVVSPDGPYNVATYESGQWYEHGLSGRTKVALDEMLRGWPPCRVLRIGGGGDQ